MAFCIKREDIIRWSSDQFDKIGRFRATARELGLPTIGSLSDILLDVALKDDEIMTNIEASRISLQAQVVVNPVGGKELYQTLPGGQTECNNCSSMGLYPVPEGTQSVMVDVVLANPAKQATLRMGLTYLR